MFSACCMGNSGMLFSGVMVGPPLGGAEMPEGDLIRPLFEDARAMRDVPSQLWLGKLRSSRLRCLSLARKGNRRFERVLLGNSFLLYAISSLWLLAFAASSATLSRSTLAW